MADDSSYDPTIPEGVPLVKNIPDQIFAAGREVTVDFSEYVLKKEGENYHYAIDDFPEGFVVGADTGIVTGVAPKPELNESIAVRLIVSNTNSEEKASNTVFFRLEIIGTILLGTPEAKAFFGDEPVNFWDAVGDYELRQFIQQLINEHFVWLYLYDSDKTPESSGEFQKLIKAKSGWNIYLFENVIMLNAGDKTFAQYGNRGRLLETLREVYQNHVPEKEWSSIGIKGSDGDNVGRAWLVGKELDMPVATQAPTEIAEINYLNKQRLNTIYGSKEPKLRPGG